MTITLKNTNYVINEWPPEWRIWLLHSLTADRSIFQSEVKHTRLIGESQGSKVIFSCLSFIKVSPDGFQLGGAFFFGGNWKHYSGDASSSSPTSFLHLRYHSLYWIFFLHIQLDKWSKRFAGIKNYWCIFKMTFAVLKVPCFAPCCYGIMCTWLHLWQNYEYFTPAVSCFGKDTQTEAKWCDRKRCPVCGT